MSIAPPLLVSVQLEPIFIFFSLAKGVLRACHEELDSCLPRRRLVPFIWLVHVSLILLCTYLVVVAHITQSSI